MVMIAAAVGVAAKWFGSKRDDADEHVQGDDPIVRAMFKAINEGDVDDLLELVDDECTMTINSYEISRNAVRDTRRGYPDIRWELYDELTGKDEGSHKIAIRFVCRSTIDGDIHQFEIAAFGIVKDKKLTEWHQVADAESYNRFRAGGGEGAFDA